jgi:hypothetical protein
MPQRWPSTLRAAPSRHQRRAEKRRPARGGPSLDADAQPADALWDNAKIAIFALLGATAGEAVVWYGGQFYALFFLTQTIKVPGVTAQIMIAIALVIGTPCAATSLLSPLQRTQPMRRLRPVAL